MTQSPTSEALSVTDISKRMSGKVKRRLGEGKTAQQNKPICFPPPWTWHSAFKYRKLYPDHELDMKQGTKIEGQVCEKRK